MLQLAELLPCCVSARLPAGPRITQKKYGWAWPRRWRWRGRVLLAVGQKRHQKKGGRSCDEGAQTPLGTSGLTKKVAPSYRQSQRRAATRGRRANQEESLLFLVALFYFTPEGGCRLCSSEENSIFWISPLFKEGDSIRIRVAGFPRREKIRSSLGEGGRATEVTKVSNWDASRLLRSFCKKEEEKINLRLSKRKLFAGFGDVA